MQLKKAYSEQLLTTSKDILNEFTKNDFKRAIEGLNQLIFQKRCAPQRKIEVITLIKRNFCKITCKIITEYRIELYAHCGSVDTPITFNEFESASNSKGCTSKIEFNE
jgi:hypothetical protein